MQDLQVLSPINMDELKQALCQATPKSKLLAGGTDLIIALKEGIISPDLLIDLSHVEELSGIKEERGSLYIGAGATFTEIKENYSVKKFFPCLAKAASRVGSTQIRNRATIGGNLANASPAGDTLPVLTMLKTYILVLNSKGEFKEKRIDELIIGYCKTSIGFDEVIIGIRIPFLKENWITAFEKLGSRSEVTIAMLNGAMGIAFNENTEEIESVCLVLGAISTKPIQVLEIEHILKKRKLDQKTLTEFIETLSKFIEKTAPIEFDMLYKKEAVRGFTIDLLHSLLPELVTRDGIVNPRNHSTK